MRNVYNLSKNFCKILPCKNIDIADIKKKMNENIKQNDDELEYFMIYFNDNWLKYFKDGILIFKSINIKFRPNNCLENFNGILKRYINTKKIIDD